MRNEPLIGSLRLSFRDCSNNGGCKNWDEGIDEGIRRTFIERMYQVNLVRNMTYNRSDTPEDAIPKNGILYVFADSSREMNQFVSYLSLPREGGGYTCTFMMAKNHLASQTSTIPRKELEAATLSVKDWEITQRHHSEESFIS